MENHDMMTKPSEDAQHHHHYQDNGMTSEDQYWSYTDDFWKTSVFHPRRVLHPRFRPFPEVAPFEMPLGTPASKAKAHLPVPIAEEEGYWTAIASPPTQTNGLRRPPSIPTSTQPWAEGKRQLQTSTTPSKNDHGRRRASNPILRFRQRT